jgi:phosphonate transport system substrate-binding protein
MSQEPQIDFSYFPGCSLATTAAESNQSMIKSARILGLNLIELEDWNCCGSSSASTLCKNLALAMAARNLSLAPAGRPLVTMCPRCLHYLRSAQYCLRDDGETHRNLEEQFGRPINLDVEIIHFMEVLVRYGLNCLGEKARRSLKGLKFVPYYGCTLARPPRLAKKYSGRNGEHPHGPGGRTRHHGSLAPLLRFFPVGHRPGGRNTSGERDHRERGSLESQLPGDRLRHVSAQPGNPLHCGNQAADFPFFRNPCSGFGRGGLRDLVRPASGGPTTGAAGPGFGCIKDKVEIKRLKKTAGTITIFLRYAMTSLRFLLRYASLAPGVLAFGLVLMIIGCSGDSDKAVVDFSQTVPLSRPGNRASSTPPLRVAVAAMISPKETFNLYRQILAYLGRKLDKDLEFVQRKTYGEIDELLQKSQIDLAFICSGPYVSGRERFGFESLAVPEVRGSHFYHSYLIVNKDSSFQRLEDLRGRTFAFTDPDSNTGRLVPTFWLAEMQEKPATFFSRIVYTYSHDNSIMAVARNLVDGATVDSLIWEFYQEKTPAFTAKTRIIKKSEPYGIPPLVASRDLPTPMKQRLREILFTMHQDPEGKKILAELMIDRFIPPQEAWYENLRRMHQSLAGQKDKAHAP